MIAKTIQANSIAELKGLLDASISGDFHPTLAIIFSSLKEELEPTMELFTKNDISVFGASSNGEFITGEYQMNSIAVMLMDVNENHFMVEITDVNDDNTFEKVREIGIKGKESFNNPAFIISGSNTSLKADLIISGLISACGEETIIIGGNSSTNALEGGIIFTNSCLSKKGMLALIIDRDKYELQGEAISGWKPVGTAKQITKSVGNWVYTLNDKPALDHLIKYIGADIDFNDANDLYNKIGSIYPVQLIQEDGTSIIIPPLYFNQEEKSFMLAIPVEEGTYIRFSLPPDFEVVESVVESSINVKNKYLPEADAMLIFSCVGRLNCLGPMVNEEISGLAETWNVPSIGFFTFGEYGRVKGGKSTFHGTTVSWVAIKEKN